MAYVPLRIPDDCPPNVAGMVSYVIDPAFREFHHLLTVRDPDQGPKGSFQRSQAILIVALADGAAQLLYPGERLRDGERFQAFLKQYYPWSRDEPQGFTRESATEFLWTEVRCSLLHRFGLRHGQGKLHKFGNVHTLAELRVEKLERDDERPFSESFLSQNAERTVLWVEAFYWGLRQAVEATLREPPERLQEMDEWISSGQFDRSKRRKS